MEIISEDSSLDGIQQFVKLAAVAVNVHDALLDVYQEPYDSGIDSDDPSPAAMQANADCSTSSDEEVSDRPGPGQVVDVHYDLSRYNVSNDDFDIVFKWADSPEDVCGSADRSSPPLLEVELTASDEDDDGSVLELVIPMQSRYQRVPTSSPKKTKKKLSVWARVFCCGRK